jgi:hypothetical protein
MGVRVINLSKGDTVLAIARNGDPTEAEEELEELDAAAGTASPVAGASEDRVVSAGSEGSEGSGDSESGSESDAESDAESDSESGEE